MYVFFKWPWFLLFFNFKGLYGWSETEKMENKKEKK